MHIEQEILIYDFVRAISEAVDLITPLLNNHHKRVAYISSSIAQQMGLTNDEIQDIILAAMLHDIGIFSLKERIIVMSTEDKDYELDRHAILGYELLKNFAPLAKAAELIRFHHADFHKLRRDIPIGSYIIHLADRVAIQFDERREILGQAAGICAAIAEKQHGFHLDAIAALNKLAHLEYFWIEANSPSIHFDTAKRVRLSKEIVDMESLRAFAKVVAQIIDFRNRFTATHSSGVAAVARELSGLSGFSERECMMIEVAGFLHDLGKLAVPNEILEKNGSLTNSEVNIVRKHTYYTYTIMNSIRGLEHIASWAAYHHERTDGNGYPFHVKGGDFSKLSRIMAVADIVTALTEDRPYRMGMDRDETENVLLSMVSSGGIDGSIVDMAISNFTHINGIRSRAQREAQREYDDFNDSMMMRDIIFHKTAASA